MKPYTTEKLPSSGSPLYRVTLTNDDGSLLVFDVAAANEAKLSSVIEAAYNNIVNPAPARKPTYAEKRCAAYPPMEDYLDGVVKNDAAQIKAYIDACKAVKAKYPKE